MTGLLRRRFAVSIWWSLGGCACVGAVVWIVVILWIAQIRDLAHEAAGRELMALATLFSDHTDRTLQGVDLMLSLLAGRLETVLAGPGGRDPQVLHDTLRAGLAGIPQLRGALVLGPDGASIGDAHSVPPRAFNGADRPEFRIHRDNPDAGLFISDAVESPVSNRIWSIPLARRLNAADGGFAGVVVGIVNPGYFASVYAATSGTGASHTTLLKKDGVVLATTSTSNVPALGQRAAFDPAYAFNSHGLLSGRSPVTGERRLAAYADAPSYPVIVITSRNESVIAESTRRSERIIIAAGVLVSGLILALAWSLSRQMHSLEARFRDGIERMPDGFLLWDGEERLIAWNSRYEQLLPDAIPALRRGVTMEQQLRATISRCKPDTAQADVEAYVNERLAKFRDPGAPWEQQLHDGRILEIEESRTAAGGIVTIYRDMTARKHHEAALESALTAEREATLLHRRFVAMASHEFRTPLAVIDSTAQRVLARMAQATPDIVARMGRIRDAVQRMTTLIDRTLSSARLEEGRIAVEAQPVDVAALLVEVCNRQRQISPSFQIAVQRPDGPLTIDGDPRLLDQVFSNLLSNAVKYSGRSRRIDVSIAAEDGSSRGVEIVMRDYGVGVHADEVEKLFGRFYRARNSAGISGTGLGLHVTRELILLHGGRIDVTSQLDLGSTFTVRLPRQRATPGVAASAP